MDLGGLFAAALGGSPPPVAQAPLPPALASFPRTVASLERAAALVEGAERQMRLRRREGGASLFAQGGSDRALEAAARRLEEAEALVRAADVPRMPGAGQAALYLGNCRTYCSERLEAVTAGLQEVMAAEAAREERAGRGVRLEVPPGAPRLSLLPSVPGASARPRGTSEMPSEPFSEARSAGRFAGPEEPHALDEATLEVTPEALRALELAPQVENALTMRAISSTLSEVALMFRKAAAAVRDQGQVILRAGENVDAAAENAEEANENLAAARRRLRGQRRKAIVAVAVLLGLFVLNLVLRWVGRALRGRR